jgi:hypothetical protein
MKNSRRGNDEDISAEASGWGILISKMMQVLLVKALIQQSIMKVDRRGLL